MNKELKYAVILILIGLIFLTWGYTPIRPETPPQCKWELLKHRCYNIFINRWSKKETIEVNSLFHKNAFNNQFKQWPNKFELICLEQLGYKCISVIIWDNPMKFHGFNTDEEYSITHQPGSYHGKYSDDGEDNAPIFHKIDASHYIEVRSYWEKSHKDAKSDDFIDSLHIDEKRYKDSIWNAYYKAAVNHVFYNLFIKKYPEYPNLSFYKTKSYEWYDLYSKWQDLRKFEYDWHEKRITKDYETLIEQERKIESEEKVEYLDDHIMDHAQKIIKKNIKEIDNMSKIIKENL